MAEVRKVSPDSSIDIYPPTTMETYKTMKRINAGKALYGHHAASIQNLI